MQVKVVSRSKADAIVPNVSTQSDTFMPTDVSLRHHKIKSEVRKGNVEHILPMIAGKARATLEKIPVYLRVHYDLEDVMAEGIAHASTTVLRAHKDKKGAGYVTLLYKSLDNLNKDLLKEQFSEKRFAFGVYSLDSDWARGRTGKEHRMMDLLNRRPDRFSKNEEQLICRIDAERSFLRLYSRSTPRLRRYLIMWLLQPSNTKLKKYGDKFLSAKKELKQNFPSAFLSMDHCRCIWRDAECRRNICKTLCQKFRTAKPESKSDVVDLEHSLEGMVSVIAFQPERNQLQCPRVL